MARGFNYWLIKFNRVTGWLFLVPLLVLAVTGLDLEGWYVLGRDQQFLTDLHAWFAYPAIVILILHGGSSLWLFIRRLRR